MVISERIHLRRPFPICTQLLLWHVGMNLIPGSWLVCPLVLKGSEKWWECQSVWEGRGGRRCTQTFWYVYSSEIAYIVGVSAGITFNTLTSGMHFVFV